MTDKIDLSQSCILKLDHLVFDNISFRRLGFRNEEEPDIRFQTNTDDLSENSFALHIKLNIIKKDEYKMEICVSGFFCITDNYGTKKEDLFKNAAAIMFPYLRSQVTVLTAQPEVEPIVMPPINISKMIFD